MQISSSSQQCTTGNLEAALIVDQILQEKERVPGLFLYYTNMKYPTFVTLLELLPCQHIQRKEIYQKDGSNITAFDNTDANETQLWCKRACSTFLHFQTIRSVSEVWSYVYRVGSISIWPHRDKVLRNTPAQFISEFPRTLTNVDCTETFIFEIAITNVFWL